MQTRKTRTGPRRFVCSRPSSHGRDTTLANWYPIVRCAPGMCSRRTAAMIDAAQRLSKISPGTNTRQSVTPPYPGNPQDDPS
jgi:hypothetical protein